MLISRSRWRRSNVKGGSKIFHWKNPGKAFSCASRKKRLHWKALCLKRKKQYCLGRRCNSAPLYPNLVGGGTVRIGRGSEIGERCRISIANSLEIGEKVLFSPNVYITDCDHEYRNVDIPVIDQGVVQKGQKVSIGEGSYIGINAVIVGNVKIGKHCVIGANSVVTKDVPDFCVAVGGPAKILRKCNKDTGEWEKYEIKKRTC